jgi:subtilisin
MSRRALVLPLLFLLLAAVLVAAGPGAAAAPSGSGDYIVVFKGSVADPAALAASQTKKLGATLSQVYKVALRGYAATIPTSRLAELTSDPSVAYVAPDAPVSLAAQVLPSGVDRVDGDLSSTASGNGTGLVNLNVAVLDTGIDPTHPDLNVVGGAVCAPGKGFADGDGHGTGVAGLIAAKDDGFGVVGVAPDARLWAVRVFGKNGGAGTKSTVLCGIDWVTSTRTDSDPSNDIAVANMSIAFKGSDDGNCGLTKKDPLHQAICRSVAAGVTYVVAADNNGADFAGTSPASYDEVLTATAMTDTDGQPGGIGPDQIVFNGTACPPDTGLVQDDTAVFFSNFATTSADQAHTVAAPGACIVTDFLGGQLAVESGTSFSSPLVAGVAALCIASGPCTGLTPAQIVQKLVSDASAYNTANPGYGFAGDPLRSQAGRYYGYLVRAALY